MYRYRDKATWGISLLVILVFWAATIVADDDSKKHRNHESRHDDDNHNEDEHLKPVRNSIYADPCGACHFAYQPELMPAESWKQVLDGIDDHFGETVDLDGEARHAILGYLTSNAANNSSAKLSRKIMRSLAGRTPMRITDIPYVRKEHRELPPQVFKRPSVGSLANCIACHQTAENGVYDGDWVSIPQ